MSYVTQTQIQAAIPAPRLLEALDDDQDGQLDADVLTGVLDSASNAVDAYLAARFEVPFETPGATVKEASFVFACELVYARRVAVDEKNPFKSRADFWRTQLEKIGKGEIGLDGAIDSSAEASWGSNDKIAMRI